MTCIIIEMNSSDSHVALMICYYNLDKVGLVMDNWDTRNYYLKGIKFLLFNKYEDLEPLLYSSLIKHGSLLEKPLGLLNPWAIGKIVKIVLVFLPLRESRMLS